jgi:hypothetical protein
MSKGEKINTVERLVVDASRVSRYLGYPRKVPIWRINFILPENCYIFRAEDNSDIALEIENMNGHAIIPALSEEEGLRRLKILIPLIEAKGKITRL